MATDKDLAWLRGEIKRCEIWNITHKSTVWNKNIEYLRRIEAALTAQQEPVAWRWRFTDYRSGDSWDYMTHSDAVERVQKTPWVEMEPLYAAPPAPAVAVKTLAWNKYKGLVGYKLCTSDPFGNEFARIDLTPDVTEAQIEEAKAAAQADYEARIRSALITQAQNVEGKIRRAGLKARDALLERMADGSSVDNDLADYLERIVDACVRAAAPTTQDTDQ